KAIVGTLDDGISTSMSVSREMNNGTGGVLYLDTPIGGAVKTTVIGGPNYRYWVDGANRDQGAGGLEGSPAEPGSWRIEIGPADSRRDTLMVNGLAVHPSDITEPPFFRPASAASDPAAGDANVVAVQV